MTEQIKSEGLTTGEALKRLELYGKNQITTEKKDNFILKTLKIISEPMFLLLLAAAVIYFILGEPRDGAIMLVFVIGIISIDVVQEWKTDKTLNALKDLSAPHINVIRDGTQKNIPSIDLVPGDIMLISEGVKIPADGTILKASDLCVNESSLTGEAEGVWKTSTDSAGTDINESYWKKDHCYAGTLVTQGSAYVLVEKTGSSTEYGKIGSNVASAQDKPTPLQKQTGKLVKFCAVIAAVLCILVGTFTFFNLTDHGLRERITESILSGITLAMAMIPEEFPVILTVFLSMGAWRLARKKSLVRKLPSVETLGAVSVLCVDKTGTITMNQMEVMDCWTLKTEPSHLCEVMGLACETDTYDPMEKAMLSYCQQSGISESHLFGGQMLKEYAFTNELKMMGHVWSHDGEIILASKGSPEKVLSLCSLTDADCREINEKLMNMSSQGLRVIAVAKAVYTRLEEVPALLTDCSLELLGLIGLVDPPRPSVQKDIAACIEAGIRVVMITGDNGITASSIASKVGIQASDRIITGDDIDKLKDDELAELVKAANIFSRVVPEHKMRIVKAFQKNGHIVAMTGDGVNDAPALKHADIGIAMGKRGSEVSREAADLILMDDNFSTIVETVRDGRRIFDNIRKAIGYVLTIHIPIAFASLLAPLINISPTNLMLLPLHVVLLELIIDPTCSIVLERQPAEKNIMERKPRNLKENILNKKGLLKSVIQGIVIFAAAFGTYLAFEPNNPGNAPVARTMSLVIIMLANLFLVQVNSSETESVIYSLKLLLRDKVMWAINLGTLTAVGAIIYTPLSGLLKLAQLSLVQLSISAAIAAASVLWYEIVKLIYRSRKSKLLTRQEHAAL